MLSYRKLAMRVLGHPLHTGGIDSPRPASQRAAAFILTAAMLTTLAAPAFAGTWHIENGDITISAGESGNDVTQNNVTTKNDTNTIITNENKDIASSHTVTIDAGNDKVEVTLEDVNIKADSGSALTSNGDVTLTLNGDNSLTGGISGNGSYGLSGISSNGSLTITGDENDSLTAQGGSGGSGIFSNGGVTISGGTVNATGGSNGSDSGDGIHSGSLTMKGGTVNATGGKSGGGGSGGNGIDSSGSLTISGSMVNATGGNGNFSGGDGIRSGGVVTISGGTVEAAGGNGSTGGGSGIYSSVIDLSGSLELTAKAGSPTGKALLQNGRELDLDTIKDKLGPGAKVTATDANGKTKQVSIPRPVEPEEPSSSSDGGSSAPSAPASPLTVCVGRFTASFRISLAALRQLRAEGIETIAFQTILCSTTLSVDELLAMGGEDAEAVLTHRLTDSSLTVG